MQLLLLEKSGKESRSTMYASMVSYCFIERHLAFAALENPRK